MNPVEKYHASVDTAIDAIRQRNTTFHPPCKEGCFWCCYEPVYASKAEVDRILESLTVEQAYRVRDRVIEWSHHVGEIIKHHMPNAIEYRRLLAPCPLLENGRCMVYALRPAECRAFFAMSDPEKCATPEEREHQKFANFPTDLMESLIWPFCVASGRVEFDHIGCLIYERMSGERLESGNREIYELEDACSVAS